MNLTVPLKTIHHTPLETRLPVIKVIGMGGGGCNAINRMLELGLSGIEFIAANTDGQALKNSLAKVRIQLGPNSTRGLGAGGNPEVGERAAEESRIEIKAALEGADMVFLTAGMGGGTGTGSIAVAAEVAHSIGAVTVGVVSTPFSFEVGRRQRNAQAGLARLRQHTDTLITVPNDKLLKIASPDLTLDLAFRMADDVLRQGIQGITEIITQTGMINVDFAHVRNLMRIGGGSLLSIGIGEGTSKALRAVEKALYHPLLDTAPLENATGIIANFTGGYDLTFQEVIEALTYLQEKTGNQCEIIPGVITDERLVDRVEVILVMTGLGSTPVDNISRPAVAAAAAAPAAAQASKPIPEPVQAHQTEPYIPRRMPVMATTPAARVTPVPLTGSSPADNLDLPAFMRKRYR